MLAIALYAQAQTDPRELLRRAEGDLQQGHYATAIEGASRSAGALRNDRDTRDYARALTVGGLARMYSGDYLAAIGNFEQALTLARASGEFGSEIARLNNIGNALYFQGRYSAALERYQEAMRRVEAVPGDRWSAWGRQFTTANIAILYQTLGQFDRALALYNGLLASEQSLPPEERAQLLANVGVLRRRLGDPAKALETYRVAQALYRGSAHRDGEIAVLNNIGIVQATDFRDLPAADATFSAALKLAELSNDRPLIVHARLHRGEARYRGGRMGESAADFEVAATMSKALGEQEEEWRALYGVARVRAAEGDSAGAKALLTSAVGVIESMRAGAGSTSNKSTFLADKRAVYDLLIENASDIGDAFRWMEASRARTLRERRADVRRLSLTEVAAKLPQDTAILEFWTSEKSAAVLWISAGSTGIRRWGVSPEDEKAIAKARAALADPARSDWRETMHVVARKVLAGIPVLSDARIRRLRIVPDGGLSQIPFEALPWGEDSLLVNRFAVAYEPAADFATGAETGARWRWPWAHSIVAFADPRPGMGSDLNLSMAWSPLPQATREVSGAASELGGRAALHVHDDARREWLGTAVQWPILHFATHALADSQNSDLSYILLAPASQKDRFDDLYLREVYDLPLRKVDLVVLSACETNVGKLVAGEGVQGFSQAFLAGGARSVVTSLWSVGDTSTAEFMLRFYRQLAKGETVAEALRTTKLQFLAHAQSAHPMHWAAFTVAGDGDFQLPRLIEWKWLLGVLTLALAAALWKRFG